MDSIADHHINGHQLEKEAVFIDSSSGGHTRREITKGWEILVQWKDGSSSWEALKDIEECYPVQLAEYAIQ
jgi:hypothetical protein